MPRPGTQCACRGTTAALRLLVMSPLEFCDFHRPPLERDEVRHNLVLAIVDFLANNKNANVTTWTLGAPGQCAVMSHGRPIVLGELNEAQCTALAEEAVPVDYPGVVGPDRTALHFAERAGALGRRFADPIPQHILHLNGRPNYPGAPGFARCTDARDATILADWVTAFIREATPFDPIPPREELESLAIQGRYVFWIVDDEPVAMARIIRRTRHAASISVVYTPPDHRRRGYAGSVTAAVSEQALAEGKTMVCLYSDQRNPASNRCYARIGFEPVCEAHHVPLLLGREA